MGASNSQIVYSIPVSKEKEAGSSHVYRQVVTKDKLLEFPAEDQTDLGKVWANSVKLYGEKPYLYTKDKDGKFNGKTYNQINDIAKAVGSAIINLGLSPAHSEWKQYSLKFVGIFAPNREEWCVLDIVNAMFGNTMVPLYDSHAPDNVTYVLKHTDMETCFISGKKVKTIVDCKDRGNLKNVVMLDSIVEEEKKSLEAVNIKVYTWEELLENGKQKPQPPANVTSDDIFTFSYTSGTTGGPKGVMLTHRNFTSVIAVLQFSPSIRVYDSDRHMSYLPMAHVFERIISIGVMSSGASAWFSAADPKQIKEDLVLIKPTFFISVPRLYNRFYDVINANFAKLEGFKKFMATTAKNTKLDNLHTNVEYTHKLWDKLIFDKVKTGTFGGSVRFMITGSAPISKEVCDFLKIAVCCPLIEGYGQTESMGATFTTVSNDPLSGHVGGPTHNTEFKLTDVPDMNYTSEDKDEKGVNTPRGEVCYRGPGIMVGYYKNQEKTDEAIDKDNWLHSGDIGMILPNGALKLIDRKKNIFKLAQGEYLAPEKIEQTLIRHEGVDEVWIYGDSLQSYCIAMIHPNEEFLTKFGKEQGKEAEYSELCADKDVIKKFTEVIGAFAKANKLAGFETPRKLHLEKESILTLGGCTPSFKIQRNECKRIFQAQIDQLYKEE